MDSVWKTAKVGHTWKPSQLCSVLVVGRVSYAQTYELCEFPEKITEMFANIK